MERRGNTGYILSFLANACPETRAQRIRAGGPALGNPFPSSLILKTTALSSLNPRSRQTSTLHERRDAAMAMAPPPACPLLLRVAAAAPSSVAPTSVSTRRGPGFLPSPRPASARRHPISAWSSKAAVSASVEIQDDYADEMDAVNIAQDVTQVHGRFLSLHSPTPTSLLCLVIWVCGVYCPNAPGYRRCLVIGTESSHDNAFRRI